MYRHLQPVLGKNIDAQFTAKVDLKRGMFVKADYANKTLEPATALADADGIVTRDVVVDRDVAEGLPVSPYADTQDIIKAGEYCGLEVVRNGERFSTDQYATITDVQAGAGQYLTVTNGKLDTSATATKIISLGYIMDAGMHKNLGFVISE